LHLTTMINMNEWIVTMYSLRNNNNKFRVI